MVEQEKPNFLKILIDKIKEDYPDKNQSGYISAKDFIEQNKPQEI